MGYLGIIVLCDCFVLKDEQVSSRTCELISEVILKVKVFSQVVQNWRLCLAPFFNHEYNPIQVQKDPRTAWSRQLWSRVSPICA